VSYDNLNDPDIGRAINVEGKHPHVLFRYEANGEVPTETLKLLPAGTWVFERRRQRWDWTSHGGLRFNVPEGGGR
jgi:hypothetical protein